MPQKTSYIDFLSDIQFIRWQIMPDEDLNKYWIIYINNHPEHYKAIHKAIVVLKKDILNRSSLSELERLEILNRINDTLSKSKNKKIKYRKLLRVTASFVAAIVLLLVINLLMPTDEIQLIKKPELIVGEILSNKDIILITNDESMTFYDDIEITLDKEGQAEVIQHNRETKKIVVGTKKQNSLIVPFGKRSMLTLSDGSRVWLNSGSVLEFPSQFNNNAREIFLLSGEMYVEVQHEEDKPFIVHTDDFNVRVYGTKFNVSNYTDSDGSLVLIEGSVSLETSRHNEFKVEPSEMVILTKDGIFDSRKVDIKKYISWKDGYLTLDKTSMTEVLNQLGRYYNLSFDFDNDINLQKRTSTGKIYLSSDLDNVMETVALLTNTEFVIEENKIYISNNLN